MFEALAVEGAFCVAGIEAAKDRILKIASDVADRQKEYDTASKAYELAALQTEHARRAKSQAYIELEACKEALLVAAAAQKSA